MAWRSWSRPNGNEPVIAKTVEPLSCVCEVLGGQAGSRAHREAGELRGADTDHTDQTLARLGSGSGGYGSLLP
jgi:hypothetical protein